MPGPLTEIVLMQFQNALMADGGWGSLFMQDREFVLYELRKEV